MIVNRPEVIEELLVTKNKFYDKHPWSSNIVKIIASDSILFARSDIEWQQKRKVISSALYKDRLRGMIETMKKVTLTTINEDWLKRERGVNGSLLPIDVVTEM